MKKMKNLEKLYLSLDKLEENYKTANPERFFKTGEGEYAYGDKFRGIPVPVLRKIAKEYNGLNFADLKKLIKSIYNEDRLLALLILVNYFKNGDENLQEKIYNFYNANIKYINNWNLVDASAHSIMGAYLFNKNKIFLLDLSKSSNLWERRIAIVSTWYFIKNNNYMWTLKIAKLLLQDKHDLIHKAVGWMLREIGKKEVKELEKFLDSYARKMPRTMLRYAIEKFSIEKRKAYLKK